jgi:acyl-CoA synthetase (AMP-forming)/AMP-acid ligase II
VEEEAKPANRQTGVRNEKPIVTLGDYSMSYCEPADRTAAVAAPAELGVCPEERVPIMLRESPGFAEAFAA